MKWYHWFTRRPEVDPQLCQRCTLSLTVCTHCEGEWRRRSCTACGLGFVCATHHASWS